MSRYGSQAQAYDMYPAWHERTEESVRFGVIRGGGLDAEARRSVSSRFVAVLRMVALASVLFFVLGAARVAISVHTVTLLNDNLQIRADIAVAEQANSDLRIERSVLSSSSRIARIATQNYGMIYAASHDRIALPTEEMKRALDAARPAVGWSDELAEVSDEGAASDEATQTTLG